MNEKVRRAVQIVLVHVLLEFGLLTGRVRHVANRGEADGLALRIGQLTRAKHATHKDSNK
jgi:hypothetical protein